ncbi:MAG: single-stranded-DNA-specific exonuclease RecJ [Clostridia bacterium]|jgi:single-stranded-DNA-specific exonuclease|nr:single-stranded-DNA-specific exonuclease RecJ [Clostridia bacterium]
MIRPKYRWELLNNGKQDVIKMLAENRKIEDIDEFLYMDNFKMYDPLLFKDMDKCIDRLIEAKDNKHRIVIYGDYDVDGITSTSIMYKYLSDNGFDVTYYIPDRIEEGYGLNKGAIADIKEMGIDLIVTVDNGITAISEAEYAKEIGIDLIITDHHECLDEIPEAVAVIDPKRDDCKYPFDMLSGCGVALKVLMALDKRLQSNYDMEELIDITAISTIADVVPLVDENRYIVKKGLANIAKSKNEGIQALLKVSGYNGGDINSMLIGFSIGPRLNAAGRLGDAKKGVELLISKDKEEAITIAEFLDTENTNRKKVEKKITDEAIKNIENMKEEKNIIVVYGENWHHGVIGIVASRITQKYYKPSIVLSLEDGMLKGSARSIDGFSIFEALLDSAELLEKFGGHEMAAGMSFKEENLDKFVEKINKYSEGKITSEMLKPKMDIDCEIRDTDVNLDFINKVALFEPFGAGNPEPVFLYKGVLNGFKAVGNNNGHLKFKVDGVDGIGFGFGEYDKYLAPNTFVEITTTLSKNEWNNNINPQFLLKDMRSKEEDIEKEDYYNSLYVKMRDKEFLINKEELQDRDLNNVDIIGVNTLKGLKELKEIFKKKKVNYKLYYNFLEETDQLAIVVNPLFITENMVMYDNIWNKNKVAIYERSYESHIYQKDEMTPSREDFIILYKYLLKLHKSGIDNIYITKLKQEIKINTFKLYFMLDVFKEVELIKYEEKIGKLYFEINKDKKVELDSSEKYNNIKTYFEMLEK